MPLMVICQAQQAFSRFCQGRTDHIPKYLKSLVTKLHPDFKPAKHVQTQLARFHNNTLAVYLHDLSDKGQESFLIVEKNNRYSLNKLLFAPEVYFYRTVAAAIPGWGRVPQCHQWEAGWFVYQLFLEYVPGVHANLSHDFEHVQQAIASLQNEAPSYSDLSEPEDRLVYFKMPPDKRFRGDYPRYLARLAGEQNVLSPKVAEILKTNLDGLANRCATLPLALNHLDLMPRNIIKRGEQMVFIDWEKFTYAPAGFSHGNWLYTAFRKSKPETLPYFVSRWRSWLIKQFSKEQDQRNWLVSGLFCYICFVLEYLTRPPKWLTAGSDHELKKALLGKFIKSIDPLLERNFNPEPSELLDQIIQGSSS